MSSSITLEKKIFNPLLPWLWFWIVFYVISIPHRVDQWNNTWETSLSILSGTSNIEIQYSSLFALASIAEFLPSIALFVGVVTIFAPKLRVALIKLELKLKYKCYLRNAPDTPVFSEIQSFIDGYEKNLKIYFTLGNVTPFVYPINYRDSAIVIPANLVKLWRSERSVAEAILLHEVAHCIHGDSIIVGAGSLFERVIQFWWPICIASVTIPFIIVIVADSIRSFNASMAIDMSILSIIYHELLKLFTITLPSLLLLMINLTFWLASIFILPLAGIWSSELYADRFAIEANKSPEALLLALEKSRGKFSWWQLLSGMSHPPTKMRKWFALKYNNKYSLVILILAIFPVAYLVKLMMLIGWAVGLNIAMYIDNLSGNLDFILNQLANNITLFFHNVSQVWLAMGCLFLVWPLIVKYWESFFCRKKQLYNMASYKTYFTCSLIMGVLYILSV